MIKVTGLCKSYGTQAIFDSVNFIISTGEKVGLVGRNGHGKSTLFRLILAEERPDSGEIAMPKRYSIGHLSQHIKFTEDTVLKEGASSLPPHPDGVDETYKIEKILHGLGFSEAQLQLDPMELSGGYQVRLNLAKALASEPDLLLLDEPTNYLDIVSIRWLKQFLRAWKREMIIITHDRDFMDSVSTHTMAIHRQKIKKVAGSTEKLYSQIAQEEEIHEQTRLNQEKIRKETEKFINRFRAQATKASAVQSRIKALEKMEKLDSLGNIKELDFEFRSAQFNGKWLMNVENVSFGYDNGPLLIESLSFMVGKRDRIGVIGKNGKGKTTLLRLLAGELTPVEGSITSHQSLKTGYFGQTNIERLDPGNTVEEEIMHAHVDCTRGMARSICGAMMFEKDNALKKIAVLSGGEKSRVLLGKILVNPANLLLLDEPTNHLDMYSIESLVEAVDAFPGAVVMVTHSELILNELANRLIVFDGNKVELFEGSYSEFLEKIGWSNERPEAEKEIRKETRENLNKKDLRRLRANINSERSKVIGPIQKRISSIEEEIVSMETTVELTNSALLKASEEGVTDEITRLSKIYHDSKSKIDSLFDELESLTAELASRTKEFEQKLNEAK